MSSSTYWDILLRSRPLSSDIDTEDDIQSRSLVQALRMASVFSYHDSTGDLITGRRRVCAGLAVQGGGTTQAFIGVGCAITARPSSFGAAGTYDDPNSVFVESFANVNVTLGAAGWYLVGARPTIVPGATTLYDEFNTGTGQFNATNAPQLYSYGITAYTVFGTATDWPAVAGWVPNTGDIPLALVLWDGTNVTRICDVRNLPSDVLPGQALTLEGETTYLSAQGVTNTLSITNRNAFVGGQSVFSNGILLTAGSLTPYLDQINSTSPLVAQQIYWVYRCGVGGLNGYYPRDAYGAVTAAQATTRGMIVLSRGAPALGAISTTTEPGLSVRVNSVALQLPAQFGGDTVPIGAAVCIGFIQIGDSTTLFRPMWSEGVNNHVFGTSLPNAVVTNLAGNPWDGWVPTTAGSGTVSITRSIYAGFATGVVVDAATSLCKSLLLDFRGTGGVAHGTQYQFVDPNQVGGVFAGDIACYPGLGVSGDLYLRARLSGSRFNPTQVRVYNNSGFNAANFYDVELLGYSW